MPKKLVRTERTRVRRQSDRAHYEQDAIYAALDDAVFATIAFYDGHNSHAIPTAVWREDDYLYIHGSNGSRLLKFLQTGGQACVSVTHLHALVLARSALHHSMNYCSVSIYGSFETIAEADKNQHLQSFLEHWLPGRWQHVRAPSKKELAATTILRMKITEAVLKSRQGPPMDAEADMEQQVWAGVAPLQIQWGNLVQVPEQSDTNLPGQSLRLFHNAVILSP